eukprot:GHVS01045381.1.p1 GENE.GHVS01045381.1~~GHVS01045381.1.p1  ORF type:complete len:122 (-),score=2.56 GHVS01045381.1:8-373(-)
MYVCICMCRYADVVLAYIYIYHENNYLFYGCCSSDASGVVSSRHNKAVGVGRKNKADFYFYFYLPTIFCLFCLSDCDVDSCGCRKKDRNKTGRSFWLFHQRVLSHMHIYILCTCTHMYICV